MDEMKVSVDSLERERDFYFNKVGSIWPFFSKKETKVASFAMTDSDVLARACSSATSSSWYKTGLFCFSQPRMERLSMEMDQKRFF